MELPDRKFAKHRRQYAVQSLLAAVMVLAVLVVMKRVMVLNLAILAALGASAFIVFALPRSKESRLKVIVGGYAFGMVIGTLCNLPVRLGLGVGWGLAEYVDIACAAVAVGLAILVMTVTDTEHPPAVGVAMGLVLGRCDYKAVGVVIVGVGGLCLARRLLRGWLKDLA